MTNFEHYKEQIKKISEKDFPIGLMKGVPVPCTGIDCDECDFNGGKCGVKIINWLYEEHVEKPTITKTEKAFLEVCKPECYIARDENCHLCIMTNKPNKSSSVWMYDKGCHLDFEYLLKMLAIDIPFSFIKWEDEEPWKVEDLLKLEVK